MAVAVLKHLELAIIIILKKTHLSDFSKKSLSGEVLALALHLGVFGVGLHPDGPGCPETP